MEGAEDFVAGNGIDPDIGAEHFPEDFGGWAGLHGEAGLEAFGGGEELDIGDALADDTGVIDPERGADVGGEGEEKEDDVEDFSAGDEEQQLLASAFITAE